MYHPRFKGDHYQMGLKYGGLIKRNNAALFGLNELDDFQYRYGVRSEKILREYFLEACEEIKDLYNSSARYQTAYDALNNETDVNIVGYAKGILGGRYGFMCQYDPEDNFETVWSSVFDVSNHKVYRAEGNPSRRKYREDTRLQKKQPINQPPHDQ